MEILCLILFLSTVVLWFFANEYSTLYGVYGPTCAMRHRDVNWLVLICLLASLSLIYNGTNAVGESLKGCCTDYGLDCRAMLPVLLSSLIVLTTFKFFGYKGSITYALIGGLTGYWIVSGNGFIFRWSWILSFAAAPLMAYILSAAVRAVFRAVFSKVKVHMITMSHYMRMVVIICIILTFCALGLNWGGMLFGIGNMIAEKEAAGICTMVITAVSAILFLHLGMEQNDEPSGTFADFSIYAVVSVGLSVAFTMIFFSFDCTTAFIGLSPVPLSASSLVIAAVAGAETAQKARLIDNTEYFKEGVSFIAVPGCSFVLTYLVFHIIGGESADHLVDFFVMGAAALILLALVFVGYARRQSIQKEATERLVYTQQQQIYENSRALNDMELKVVLSENQALHNTIEMKKQEVMNVALSIVEQREYLESLNNIIKQISKTSDERERDRLLSELGASLKQRLSYDRDVDSQYFYAQAESLHEDFNAKLSENFPHLTPQDRRLATLLRLGFSSKYIATLMNITPKSVEISRYRLRQKLGLSKGDNLVNYIKSI